MINAIWAEDRNGLIGFNGKGSHKHKALMNVINDN